MQAEQSDEHADIVYLSNIDIITFTLERLSLIVAILASACLNSLIKNSI